MKKVAILGMLGVLGAAIPASALEAVDRAGNGGDACELRILEIREDLSRWLASDASRGLAFPAGMERETYVKGMLAKFASATVSCQDDSVFVGSSEKTCKNLTDAGGKERIVCNRKAFLSGTGDDSQYVLVHHEFAGLAGFEVNRGEQSDYALSEQLTRFLVDTGARKLGLRPRIYVPLSDSCKEELTRKFTEFENVFPNPDPCHGQPSPNCMLAHRYTFPELVAADNETNKAYLSVEMSTVAVPVIFGRMFSIEFWGGADGCTVLRVTRESDASAGPDWN